MTRLPELTDRESLPAEVQPVFDAIAESRGGIRGPFPWLLHSPPVAEQVGELGHYLRFGSALPDADREIAIITAAREADCAYEFAAHARLASSVGVADETIDAVAHRRDLDAFEPGAALVVRYARELLGDHRLSDETFAAAKERYGEQGVIDLTALCGYYTMVAAVLNAMEATPPADWPQLPA